MTMITLQQAASTPLPWHRQGMFFGMHWAWWFIWVATALVLLWAIWRIHTDRREVHREAARRLSAEEELRRRFARGEIDEGEYVTRLRVLAADGRVEAPSR